MNRPRANRVPPVSNETGNACAVGFPGLVPTGETQLKLAIRPIMTVKKNESLI